MLRSIDQIIDAGLRERIFDDHDLARVFGGTAARRYALVNKALAQGELLRLRRGLYCLGEMHRTSALSPFHIASRFFPISYVSMASALSFHQWIPERVVGVQSVIPEGRNAYFDCLVGPLQYSVLRTPPGTFLCGVSRFEDDGLPFLMAGPLRALVDQVRFHRVKEQGTGFLTESLRIPKEKLRELRRSDFREVSLVYPRGRTARFLTDLERELGLR